MKSIKHPDGIQVLIALDQLANTLLCGYADETLSSRAHRHALKGDCVWPEKLINALFFWQKDHCKQAYESEVERTQLPPSMRETGDAD